MQHIRTGILIIIAGFFSQYGLAAQGAISVTDLNTILLLSDVEKPAIKIRNNYAIQAQGEKYTLYMASVRSYYGDEQCCMAVAVNANEDEAIVLPGDAVEVNVVNVDGDATSEVILTQTSIQMGISLRKKAIYQLQGNKFHLLHQFQGGSNEGMYKREERGFESRDAEFAFKDINNDGKNELIEKIITVRNGRRHEDTKYYQFNGRTFSALTLNK